MWEAQIIDNLDIDYTALRSKAITHLRWLKLENTLVRFILFHVAIQILCNPQLKVSAQVPLPQPVLQLHWNNWTILYQHYNSFTTLLLTCCVFFTNNILRQSGTSTTNHQFHFLPATTIFGRRQGGDDISPCHTNVKSCFCHCRIVLRGCLVRGGEESVWPSGQYERFMGCLHCIVEKCSEELLK